MKTKRFYFFQSQNQLKLFRFFEEEVFFAVAVLQEEVVDFLELEQDFFAEDLQEDLLFSWSTAIAQNSWSLPDGQPLFCQRK